MSGTLPLFSNPGGSGSGPGESAAARGVQAVLASSGGPWRAAQIRKQWTEKPAPKPAAIEAALLELEAGGAAHRLPGARGAVLWSAKPLSRWLDEAAERMLGEARASAGPVAEKKLLASAWPKQLDPAPVQERLRELARGGLLKPWPGKAAAWWHTAPQEALGEALLAALGSRALDRRQWLRAAKARLRGPSAAEWQQAAGELIASGRVMVHATKVEGRRVEACVRAGRRAALLEIYRPLLDRLREEWRRLGIGDGDVQRFLARREEAPAAALLEELRRLEMESPPPNPVARLRRRPALQQWSKDEFDRAALELLRLGRVYMAPHDHPMRLPAQEREELVAGGEGTFYVSISARP